AFPISDITVVSERTDASTAYLSDWFVVSFVFSTAGSDETIAGDATIEVSIPNELEFVQYPDSVDPSVSEFFTTAGVQVLSTAFDYDSHVLTFTFSDPGQVITDLEGVVFFTLKLSEQFTESASPGQHTFDFETSDQTYSPSVDLVALDRSQPIKLSNAVTGGVEWFVDIPGAFGDITNIDISTVQTPGTFDCSEVKYAVGSSLNEFGDFTPQDRTTFFSNSSSGEWIPITPASGLPVESFECGDGTISLSFAGELADDEVLRVSFLSNLADDVLEVQNVVNVDLTTADSRKRALTSFVLDEPFYRASRTDTAAFEAFAAV
nr:Chain U, ZONADHESIN [Komagataella phaffii CBS 7435]